MSGNLIAITSYLLEEILGEIKIRFIKLLLIQAHLTGFIYTKTDGRQNRFVRTCLFPYILSRCSNSTRYGSFSTRLELIIGFCKIEESLADLLAIIRLGRLTILVLGRYFIEYRITSMFDKCIRRALQGFGILCHL